MGTPANMGGGADNMGSEDHYEQWKRDGGEVRAAENEMMQKTESMRGDIKERMVLGMAEKLEAGIDAQMAAMEEEMGDLASLRKKRIQQMQKDAQLKKVRGERLGQGGSGCRDYRVCQVQPSQHSCRGVECFDFCTSLCEPVCPSLAMHTSATLC